MPFRERIPVYCERYTKHFSTLNQVVHVITTGFKGLSNIFNELYLFSSLSELRMTQKDSISTKETRKAVVCLASVHSARFCFERNRNKQNLNCLHPATLLMTEVATMTDIRKIVNT
jgi:hypothetical protein